MQMPRPVFLVVACSQQIRVSVCALDSTTDRCWTGLVQHFRPRFGFQFSCVSLPKHAHQYYFCLGVLLPQAARENPAGMSTSSGSGVEAPCSRVCPESLHNTTRRCEEQAIPTDRSRAANEGGNAVTTEACIRAFTSLLYKMLS